MLACAHCRRAMPARDAEGHPRRYCSRACCGAAKRRERACAGCGETFHGRGRHRYCSRRCARAAQPAAIRARRLAACVMAEPVETMEPLGAA